MSTSAQPANDAEAYESYPGFLKAAIRRTFAHDQTRRLDLVAMLLATREAWEVAWDGATSKEGGRTLLKGAAGAAAVTVLLRTILGGPIGMLLTGASVASLAALYARHHERIWTQVERYRERVEAYRPQYDEIHFARRDGALSVKQRDLMIDGLLSRLLADFAAIPHLDEA